MRKRVTGILSGRGRRGFRGRGRGGGYRGRGNVYYRNSDYTQYHDYQPRR